MPAALVFAGTFVWGVLSWSGFHNDQFMHLAWADQVRLGELPLRDFAEPGMPLTYLSSLAARWVVGPPLAAEVVLSVAGLSLGAVLSFLLAARASGSRALGAAAAALQVLLAPRLYAYPKILLHLWALWAGWRYADRPSRGRLAGLAACTAVAFLFRHDHGLFIGVASLVLLAAVHWPRERGLLGRRILEFGGATCLLLLPFLVYVQLSAGLVTYVEQGLRFNQGERTTRRLNHWPPFTLAPPEVTPPRVTVRWAEEVPDDQRDESAARHGLTGGERVSGRTWRYDLTDASQASVLALLADSAVEDTGGIDRTRSVARDASASLLTGWSRGAARAGWETVAGLLRPENAQAWLFRVFMLMPVVAAVVLLVAVSAGAHAPAAADRAFVIMAVSLGAMTASAFLRDPLSARLADACAVPIVLGAWLTGRLWRGASRALARRAPAAGLRLAGAAVMLTILAGSGLTTLAALEVGDLSRALSQMDVPAGPRAMARHARDQVRLLRREPAIDAWEASGDERATLKRLTRYARECTRPSDRLLVTWFEPEVYFYAERGFAAGLAFFSPGFFTGPADRDLAVTRWERQRVPIVIDEVRRHDQFFATESPHLDAYLRAHYREAARFPDEHGMSLRVLVDDRVPPTGTDPALSLPCFSSPENP